MLLETAGKSAVSSLTTHIVKWIANLTRAGEQRKQQSRQCLEKVILAVVETRAYVRQLEQSGIVQADKELEIAKLWLTLAFELEQLKLHKLAKKCKVKGWYWEDQGRFDEIFLQQAQVSFKQIETMAKQLINQLNQ